MILQPFHFFLNIIETYFCAKIFCIDFKYLICFGVGQLAPKVTFHLNFLRPPWERKAS